MGGASGSSVMGIEWSLLGVAYVFVATRMFVRLHNQQKNLLVSDLLLLLSAVFALGLAITDTMTYELGGLGDEEIVDASTLIKLRKIAFAGNYFYDTCIYFPKFSILALYSRLIPSTMPRLRIALWVVSGFVVVCCLTTCFSDTFWCGANVASNWSLADGACVAFDSLHLFNLDWSLNFISDVLIFALPFPLFRNLTLQKRQLYGLIFTFGLGMITVVVNVARYATIRLTNNFNAIYVWGMAEMATSIMVACLPALRSLLRRAGELSSSDYKSSKSRIARTFGTALSKIGVSRLGSSRVENLKSSRRGNGVDRMERLSDGRDSQVELTTQSRTSVIYKTQSIHVQSTRYESSDSAERERERPSGLGNDSKAWHR
ncbi:hypothetical protein GLAREA_07181 [Glarea lozoyensis ATCC 20868]|uniref:Rhodopsin domain-containing protein n=1 Tax=Glarea lozoyensis (strain ATCC 20868 / MF5171) TaxID=1116229 RepID=S3E753_GLAL2|nr:uncharacterized protein GLAREA_07181 [Glarea lozoyensis ATCC 20868]EPE34168.1 hypothetical protein GLAREA_07181 [Glarea lozoyensis ATCC 20868]